MPSYDAEACVYASTWPVIALVPLPLTKNNVWWTAATHLPNRQLILCFNRARRAPVHPGRISLKNIINYLV